jgi:hypothetical protein
MNYNRDFKYDLKIGQIKEENLNEILSNSLIEVKYDLKALETGNVFVEYESRGKPSGIATTLSDWYCFAISDTFHFINTKDLSDRCRKYLKSNRDVLGGDNNTSKGILLPIKELF